MFERGRVTPVDFRTLAAALARRGAGKRVIGFDVFDTLLRRRVQPETVKDLAARWLARQIASDGSDRAWPAVREQRRRLEREHYAAAERAGDDAEYRLRSLAAEWAATAGAGDPIALARALVSHELELERCATFPTPGVEAVLAGLRAAGQRLVFVSDSYLSGDDLWGLLRHHGLAEYFAAGYCSSDVRRTKRSGRLFEHVLRAEALTPRELLFVGDNPCSDAESASRLGIDVLRLDDAEEARRRLRLRWVEELAARERFWVGALQREIVEGEPRHLRPGGSVEYRLGRLLAPVYVAFTRWVNERARELGLGRLLFLSREGLTFLRMYRRLAAALGPGAGLPPATYVAVSRIATFLPALPRLDLPALGRMLRQYDNQSLARLLRNLSLPLDEFVPLARRHGFTDPEAPLGAAATSAPLRAFLADPEVQARFTAHRDRARALLCDYLRAKGYFAAPAVGLVDIGWKASIQDNLVRAVADTPDRPTVHGLYFGLVHVAADDVPGSHKHGYMADARRGDWLEQVVFKNGPVFEMFSSAGHGGVVGYAPRPGARVPVRPVLHVEPVERRVFRRYATDVFRGIDDYLREYLERLPLLVGTAAECRPYLLDQLRRYILYPRLDEARAFLRYSHVESFGVFHQTTYEFKGSWRRALLGGPPLGAVRRVLQMLQREFWPEAYLRRLRIPLANFVYDLLETRYGGRHVPAPPPAASSE